jgi:hypothetical protein
MDSWTLMITTARLAPALDHETFVLFDPTIHNLAKLGARYKGICPAVHGLNSVHTSLMHQ